MSGSQMQFVEGVSAVTVRRTGESGELLEPETYSCADIAMAQEGEHGFVSLHRGGTVEGVVVFEKHHSGVNVPLNQRRVGALESWASIPVVGPTTADPKGLAAALQEHYAEPVLNLGPVTLGMEPGPSAGVNMAAEEPEECLFHRFDPATRQCRCGVTERELKAPPINMLAGHFNSVAQGCTGTIYEGRHWYHSASLPPADILETSVYHDSVLTGRWYRADTLGNGHLERNNAVSPAPAHSWSVPGGFASEVQRLVTERGSAYGTPAENHQLTAEIWGAWLSRRLRQPIVLSAEDVCMLNVLQKQSRLAFVTKDDSWFDVAGYTENVAMLKPEQRNTTI